MNMGRFAGTFEMHKWLFCSLSRSLAWPLATQAATLIWRENLTSLLLFTNRMSEVAQSEDVGVPALTQGTQMPFASASSRSQQMVVLSDAGTVEDAHGSVRQFDSPLDSARHDDDSETVKGFSDDGHSYAGTIVRGVLRGDSE